jgi:predicted acylesterase/phospholipase RssA
MRVDEEGAPSRIALCLGGGGITGAMYQVGVLAALEDAFDPFRASSAGIFVAAGSGAPLAASLAGGISALRIYRALLNPSDDLFPLRRHHLLRADERELRRVVRSLVGAGRRMVGSYLSRPLDTDLWDELDRFWDSLPAGIFSLDSFERFLADFFARRGIPDTFADLPQKLLIVASDLDEGKRTIFGDGHVADVPITRAIAASCALPVLYAPVRIGDRDYVAAGPDDVAHVDLAADAGAKRIVVINPAVPVRTDLRSVHVPTGHGPRKRVRDKGLLWVHSQAFRLQQKARLDTGLTAYEEAHPELEVHLIEPACENAVLFMHSPMNFAARRAILEDAYRATRRALRAPSSPLRSAFEAEGLALQESVTV